jgi:hypothetical protein
LKRIDQREEYTFSEDNPRPHYKEHTLLLMKTFLNIISSILTTDKFEEDLGIFSRTYDVSPLSYEPKALNEINIAVETESKSKDMDVFVVSEIMPSSPSWRASSALATYSLWGLLAGITSGIAEAGGALGTAIKGTYNKLWEAWNRTKETKAVTGVETGTTTVEKTPEQQLDEYIQKQGTSAFNYMIARATHIIFVDPNKHNKPANINEFDFVKRGFIANFGSVLLRNINPYDIYTQFRLAHFAAPEITEKGGAGTVNAVFYSLSRMLKSRYFPLTAKYIDALDNNNNVNEVMNAIAMSMYAEESLINKGVSMIEFKPMTYYVEEEKEYDEPG